MTEKRSIRESGVEIEPQENQALAYDVRYEDTKEKITRSKFKKTEEYRYHSLVNIPNRRQKAQETKKINVCADGDSWINILWPFSGYPKTFFDVIQDRFYNKDVAWPGSTFQTMLREKDYKQPLQSGIFDTFIFSGGGVDVLGGGALIHLLKKKEAGNGSSDPSRYIDLDALEMEMGVLETGYLGVAREVEVWTPKTKMLVHGYDYPVPRKNGRWMGKPLQSKGYRHDDDIARKIMTHLVDRFYDMLASVEDKRANVKRIDLRGLCKGRWHDELHAKAAASEDFAEKFIAEF